MLRGDPYPSTPGSREFPFFLPIPRTDEHTDAAANVIRRSDPGFFQGMSARMPWAIRSTVLREVLNTA